MWLYLCALLLTPLKPHSGKNRALDEDELEFIAAVEGAKAAQEAAWEAEQDRELDGFREVAPPLLPQPCGVPVAGNDMLAGARVGGVFT